MRLLLQLRVELMELMKEAGVTDAETDEPITGESTDTQQSVAFQQLLQATDDLAALDKLDEVLSNVVVEAEEMFIDR